MRALILIIIVLLLIGALPTWPYSAGWGYYPGGGLGLILIIVIVLIFHRPVMTAAKVARQPVVAFVARGF